LEGKLERKKPSLTVDAIILNEKKEVLLIKRKNEPFKDFWALPGGFVEYGERTEEAVVREVKEETGLDVEIIKLHNVYSDPERDPRGHTISIVYNCKIIGGNLKGGDDAKEAKFFEYNENLKLAFDHKKILEDFFGR
jgi:8-oxo-dGTP diphosphatase